jgi:uncharacterized protein YcbX
MPSVARIGVTPVKSLALAHPDEVSLGPAGVPGDRSFYVVDDEGKMFSARQFGPMQTIVPSFDDAADTLSLTFPDGSVVAGAAGELAEPLVTDFWGRPVRAHALRGPWADALSAFIGSTVRLARCDQPGDGTDVYHVTLMSRASVAELAARGGAKGDLDSRRFRMTFELDGCAPHEEDTWAAKRVRFGEALLRVYGQVPRCVLTTRSPSTGMKDFDTLKVIAAYRELMPNQEGIPFGMYAEVEHPGRVRVGDDVEVLG